MTTPIEVHNDAPTMPLQHQGAEVVPYNGQAPVGPPYGQARYGYPTAPPAQQMILYPAYTPVYAPPPEPRRGLGISSMVIGIVAMVIALPPFVLWFFGIAIPLGVTAIILGAIALRKVTRRGMAITGVVLGSLATFGALVLGAIVILFYSAIFFPMASDFFSTVPLNPS